MPSESLPAPLDRQLARATLIGMVLCLVCPLLLGAFQPGPVIARAPDAWLTVMRGPFAGVVSLGQSLLPLLTILDALVLLAGVGLLVASDGLRAALRHGHDLAFGIALAGAINGLLPGILVALFVADVLLRLLLLILVVIIMVIFLMMAGIVIAVGFFVLFLGALAGAGGARR